MPTADPAAIVLAHRGYASRYPENTLEALQAAVQAGARHLEFDVQLTLDRVPLLLHDDTFSRTGNNPARVTHTDFTAAASIPVGEDDRLGHRFPEARAPSLERVVSWLITEPGVTAFVELKRHSLEAFGVEAVLDAVLPVLAPLRGRCVVISFDHAVLSRARVRGDWPVGWALRQWNEEARRLALQLAPDFLFCNVTRLPVGQEPLWPGPWVWVVYEIIDGDEARALLRRGVGMIETMQPGEMLQALSQPAG